MIKQHFEDINSSNLERYGYLTPFTSQEGFFILQYYIIKIISLIIMVEKILGKSSVIFKTYKDDINENDDIFRNSNDNIFDKDIDTQKEDNNITNSKELKQVIYSEKV